MVRSGVCEIRREQLQFGGENLPVRGPRVGGGGSGLVVGLASQGTEGLPVNDT